MQKNDLFQRPASYWLRRAERCHQSGDLVRAAVLERHAVRADAQSDPAAMSYVLTLRQLSCYEASNREAFAALAADPSRKDLYGLVGQNMLAMGLRGPGQDALNIYLSQPAEAVIPSWHDDAYDLACSCDELPIRRRKARFDGLLAIAARRIAQEDKEGAKRALTRASHAPYQAQSSRRDLAWALYHLRFGDPRHCIAFINSVILHSPRSPQLLSSAAGMLWTLEERRAARMLLTRAAYCACVPADELAVLMASDQLHAPHIALGMLRRAHKNQPHRYPVLYDLCVCQLKLGRLEEAMRHIHLCREIDPDDVPGEILFAKVTALDESGASPAGVRRAARDISWYGVAGTSELNASVEPLLGHLSGGPEELAQAVMDDKRIRQRFLHLMDMPVDWPAKLLTAVGLSLPENERETLMREVLLRHPHASAAKRCAVSILHAMNAPPPYAAWQDGRLGWVDPTKPAPESPAFRQRFLTRRIGKAQRLLPGDRGFSLWAMQLVHSMSRAQRNALIADPMRIWPMALCARYRTLCGMEMLHIDLSRMNRLRLCALAGALRMLHSLT